MTKRQPFTAATLRHAAEAVERRAGKMLAEAINLDACDRLGGPDCRKVAVKLQREAAALRARADMLDTEGLM